MHFPTLSSTLFGATLTLVVTTAAANLSAQTLADGYTSTSQTLPSNASAVYDLPGPGVVYFDGSALVLDDGTQPTPLLTFAVPPAFSSFTIPFGNNAVVFGESDTGGIWFVPLNGATPRFLTDATFNFDAVQISDSEILVSAKTGGFAVPDNDLIKIDVGTGATEFIGALPGFSGPVSLDRDGNLFYGLGSEVVRIAADVVASATESSPFGMADATSIVTGLSATLKLAVDADGDIFVSDFGGQLIEVSTDESNPTRMRTFATGMGFADPVMFHDAPDQAGFEPFQPSFGKALSYVIGGEVITVTPSRPTLTVPQGTIAGPFTVTVEGAPAASIATLMVGDGSGAPFVFPRAMLSGLEQPVFFGSDSLLATINLPAVDAAGSLTLNFPAPAMAGALATVQLLFGDLSGSVPLFATSDIQTLTF